MSLEQMQSLDVHLDLTKSGDLRTITTPFAGQVVRTMFITCSRIVSRQSAVVDFICEHLYPAKKLSICRLEIPSNAKRGYVYYKDCKGKMMLKAGDRLNVRVARRTTGEKSRGRGTAVIILKKK